MALPFFLSCYQSCAGRPRESVSERIGRRDVLGCLLWSPVVAEREMRSSAWFPGCVIHGWVSTQSVSQELDCARGRGGFTPSITIGRSSSAAGFIALLPIPAPTRGLFLFPTLCICSILRFRKRRASIILLGSRLRFSSPVSELLYTYCIATP